MSAPFGLAKCHGILTDAGYKLIRTLRNGAKINPNPGLNLEWWGGRRGVIIVQYEGDGGDGILTYADWPTGIKWDELEAMI